MDPLYEAPVPGTATEKLNAIFKARGVELQPCSLCGAVDSYALNVGHFIAPINLWAQIPQLATREMPLISLSCTRCTNTVFLNALSLGIDRGFFLEDWNNAGN